MSSVGKSGHPRIKFYWSGDFCFSSVWIEERQACINVIYSLSFSVCHSLHLQVKMVLPTLQLTGPRYGMIDQNEALSVFEQKPDDLHIVVTGRGAHSKMRELADLVTEMQPVKHPYEQGIIGQKGVEF